MALKIKFYLTIAAFLISLITVTFTQAQTAFSDVTKQAGIAHSFEVYEGMFGGGAAVLDFNNDGWEDIYLTGGIKDDALYKNNGNGTFTNIFQTAGLAFTAEYVTQGVATADINKDGWVDLFVTTITKRKGIGAIPRAENLVLINNGNSTFRNSTKEFGINTQESFSTGVSFGDFNNDGFSDVFVGNYFLDYEGQLNSINDATIVNANQTAFGYLLKNINGKSFLNVFPDYRLNQRGFGFGGIFTDFDNDHDLDLILNHDFGYKATPNAFLENSYPTKKFVNLAFQLNMDLKMNSMGTAVGDINNDGQLDYYFTNIRFNKMMVSQGLNKPYLEESKERGLGYVAISWGTNFADFDNDGDLDLFVSNGDLNPNDVAMADFYFENRQGKFTEVARVKGLNNYGIGRGSIVFDFDNDGDLDLLVVNQKPVLDYPVDSQTTLYQNNSTFGNWVKIQLKGVQSDAHGIGSRIKVVAGNNSWIREIDGGSSHLSQNSTIAHFGLGPAKTIDSIIVTWVGGKRQVVTKQPINSLITLTEVEGYTSSSISWSQLILLCLVGSLLLAYIFYKIFRSLFKH